MKTFQINDYKFHQLFAPYCNLEEGPWIAGGSVRKVWEGKSWHLQDVDFFFKNPKQFSIMETRISEFGEITNKHLTNNAATFTVYTGPNRNSSIWNLDSIVKESDDYSKEENYLHIQLIQKNWYPNAWALITDFDLGLSQFVTDGTIILTTSQAIEDVKDRTIRSNRYKSKEVTPQRLTKYCAYGYSPDLNLLKNVLKTTMKSGYGDVDY